MAEITLRPLERNDLPQLIRWIPSAKALMLWTGPYFRFPLDEAQLEEHLVGTEGPNPIRRAFTAIDEAGQPAGHIELNAIDAYHRVATVARVLVGEPARRGQGIGAQMVRLVLSVGFEELRLHRVDLLVFDFNVPAIACYEKVGFVTEGRQRDWRRFGDEYWSVYRMSMLEHEWRELKGGAPVTPGRTGGQA